MKKQCKATTREGKQCSRNAVRFGYCKQHLGIRTIFGLGGGGIVVYILLQLIVPYVWEKGMNEVIGDGNDFDCEKEKIIQGIVFEDFTINSDTIIIQVSDISPDGFGIPLYKPKSGYDFICPFEQGNDCHFSLRFGDNNEFLISMDIFSPEGNAIGIIKDNYIRVNDDCSYMFNSDEKAIEIVDNHLNVILSMELISQNKIVVKGIFKTDKGYLLINGGRVARSVVDETMDWNYIRTISRIFEYTGPDWRNKRVSL